jgi:hypothetical protein
VLAGTLYFGPALRAAGTMGYNHEELGPGPALRELASRISSSKSSRM